jgi:hypothetical protein
MSDWIEEHEGDDPAFWDVFWSAFEAARGGYGGTSTAKDLANYLDSYRPPLTRNMLHALAELLRQIPDRKRGRGHQLGQRWLYRQRRLAWRVVDRQNQWCKQNLTKAGTPRKNIPERETRRIIDEEISADPTLRSVSELQRKVMVADLLKRVGDKSRLPRRPGPIREAVP